MERESEDNRQSIEAEYGEGSSDAGRGNFLIGIVTVEDELTSNKVVPNLPGSVLDSHSSLRVGLSRFACPWSPLYPLRRLGGGPSSTYPSMSRTDVQIKSNRRQEQRL